MFLSREDFFKVLCVIIKSVFFSSCSQELTLPAGDIDNGGLFLPDGFEAVVVIDSIGYARHLAVNDNGDIYVKLTNAKQDSGNVAIRDINNNGKADSVVYFGDYKVEKGYGPTSMRIYDGYIYFSTKHAIYRQKLTSGKLVPESNLELVLTDDNHTAEHIGKSLAFDDNGHMYVNFGSITNNCQIEDRTRESPGQYPCSELSEHAGIWRFDANKLDQTIKDGYRYATGLRDGIAMDWNHTTNSLFAIEHGRDALHQHWPSLYSEWESAMLPSEEFFEIEEGMNGGWPYYYYDQLQNKKVVSPEYIDVDLKEVSIPTDPIIGFPGHWAPNDLFFYSGNQFPAYYKNGAFIAFHGGHGRSPYPQGGYFVGFVPFKNGVPSSSWEVFADGFAGKETIVSISDAVHRPMGIAMGPDGSLYISDSKKGKIWRIIYRGNKENFGSEQLAEMEKRKMLRHIKTPDKIKDNLVKSMEDVGKKTYDTYCISCHQGDGKGDGNRYPPIVESDWVMGDKNRLITVILDGLEGPIRVNGKPFNDMMPKHDFLSDKEIANVLSYIRLNFENDASAIDESEVADVRAKLKDE